jgi:excisionase family DNA binding protein
MMEPPDTAPTKYLTPEEVAKVLRVDRRTVYRWLRKGKIPAVKFGGTWRVPETALLAE